MKLLETFVLNPERYNAPMSLSTLDSAVKLFETFPKETKIQGLISLADSLPRLAPKEGETWDVEDVEDGHVKLAAEVGKEVTTLTRALTSLFVENLSGETTRNILSVDASIIPRIVGEALMRQRSNTAYYTLRRIHEAVKLLETQQAG
jgi:sulfur transfer protein SufE